MNRLLVLVAVIAAAGGCRDESVTHPVRGRVTLAEGGSINVGLVEFVPRSGGPSPRGVITPGGDYELTTFEPGDGAPAGDYVVLVSQPQLLVGLLRPAPEGHDAEHHGGEATGSGVAPRRYAMKDSSPLRATVRPGDNRVDLVLESSPPGEEP